MARKLAWRIGPLNGVRRRANPASVAFQQALYQDGVPLTQLYSDDLRQEHRRLKALGVAFRDEPKPMGPTLVVDFDDTCGNLIRLVEG
jgi:hypothetical protein